MHNYEVEYLPMDVTFTLKIEEPCTKDQICMFIDHIIATRPTKSEAIKKAPHFFSGKVLDLDGYVQPELDDELVYVKEL